MVDSEHPVDQKRLKYSIEASQLDIYVKSLKKVFLPMLEKEELK